MAGTHWLEQTQTVVAPDDRVWTVRRVLLPRPPRWRGRKPGEKENLPEGSWVVPVERKRKRDSDGSNWLDALHGLDFVGDVGDAAPAIGAVLLAIGAAVILFVFAWFIVFPVR